MNQLFISLTLILGLASLFAIVARLLRQPLIVAYIATGITLSAIGATIYHDFDVWRILPEIGIAFLLFLIGMELDIREIAKVGRGVTVSTVVQILISLIVGFILGNIFGLPTTEALYIGIALSFSSTIVVIKLLADRHDETSLHGRLSIGILLVEDLVAVLILMFATLSSSSLTLGLTTTLPLVSLILKAVLFFSVTIYLSRFLLPTLFGFIARSTELLLLSAIALCFTWVTAAQFLGFSLQIGAFLAGLALASSPYRVQIAGRIRPLRDFFVTLFFIDLGTQAHIGQVLSTPLPFFIFLLYAVIVKPLIFLAILSLLGYRKHPTFLTSINLTQISEFSLIVLVAGKQAGLVSETMLSTFALVGAVSIAISSILITRSKKIYPYLTRLLALFEQGGSLTRIPNLKKSVLENHIIVVGCHQSGGKVVEYIAEKHGAKLVAVDFNPEIVKTLHEKGINVVFGDIADPEIVDEVNVQAAKLIISTIRDFDDNHLLLIEAKKAKGDVFVIMAAQTQEDAEKLTARGADKVIVPLALEGAHIVNFLSREYFAKG